MLCARTARLPWSCRRADPHRSAVAEMKLLLLWVTSEIGGNRGPLLRLERQRSGGSGCKVCGSNGTVVPWWVLVRARRPVQAFRWRNLKEKRLGFSHNNLLKFNH